MDIRPGSTLDGPDGQRITIEAIIGRGGFGQVFLGQVPDDTKVAVKTVLAAAPDDNRLRTLQDEVRHSVAIERPNGVRVLQLDEDEASHGRAPYLVMEYGQGRAQSSLLAAWM
jgi:serine/threonine protein kinase